MVGSMAMAAQGLVRATRDVDFFVAQRDSMKKDTVRPQDRLDAEQLRRLFKLEGE
jgi:hypothetical protein